MKSPIIIGKKRTFVASSSENEYLKMMKMKKKNEMKFFFEFLVYPSVDPLINSAWALIVSAINSSLYASRAFLHFLPPGKTNGRSLGVLGPSRIFDGIGFLSVTFSKICCCNFF